MVECASDRLWGTGIPLNDPMCFDPNKWITQGIMGQILEGILQSQRQPHYWPAMSSSTLSNTINPSHSTSLETLAATANTSNSSLSAANPLSEHLHSSLPPPNNEHSCIADESESASTTPVSDTTETTTSNLEVGELHPNQSESHVSAMEESTPT